MKVLEEIKNEIYICIDHCLEQECLNENITIEEVIFLFTCLEAKN